jgi:hypothetical protein
MRRRKFSEGTVFLVPLKNGGYGRGVIARADVRGAVLLGYFFGPRIENKEGATVHDLNPADAVLLVQFGALGLRNGEWPIIGSVPKWDRAKWPMPDFVRRDPLGYGKPILVRYCDDDPSKLDREFTIDDDRGLTTDSLYGYGAVEIELGKRVPAAG